MKIGKCVLHFFKDGDFAINPRDMFPGYSQMKWAKLFLGFYDNLKIVKELRDEKLVKLSFGCCLVQSEGKNIMLDTAVGIVDPIAPSKQDLRKALKAVGVDPCDVDYVVYSHLHRDHTGWTMVFNENNEIVPLFKNA